MYTRICAFGSKIVLRLQFLVHWVKLEKIFLYFEKHIISLDYYKNVCKRNSANLAL